MQTQTQSNIDYAVQAKSALAAIERFSDELESVPHKTSMCREKWRDYGAALLAQRVLMPSNQAFGQWVKTNGLDHGRASNSVTRSNAMWLAEHFDILVNKQDVTFHDPTNIRTQCREAGYEWAGETSHQKERKAKSVRTKARRKSYSWQRIAASEGIDMLISINGSARQQLKAELAKIGDDADLFTAAHETQFRAACQAWIAQHQPGDVTAIIEEARATVSESARERFDKAVAKTRAALEGAYNAKMIELQASFEAEVQKRIAPELEAERKRLQEAVDRNRREWENFIARRDGIKLAMTKTEFKFLLNCLHPDREPEGREAKFSRAFEIVNRLQPYIDS